MHSCSRADYRRLCGAPTVTPTATVLGRKEPGGPRVCLRRPLRPRASASTFLAAPPDELTGASVVAPTPIWTSGRWPFARGIPVPRLAASGSSPSLQRRAQGVYRIVRPRLPGVGPRRQRAGPGPHNRAHAEYVVAARSRNKPRRRSAGPSCRRRPSQRDLLGEHA